jgi:YfiH family protein
MPKADPSFLRPDWPAPEGVGAVMSTRGAARDPTLEPDPFASFNLRNGLGDDDDAVLANQARFAERCGAMPTWLKQVHGTRVLRLDRPLEAMSQEADAVITTRPGVVCAVQVADCLPVLFAASDGRVVGAAHAGWRGLAAGVLEATLQAMVDDAGVKPVEVLTWLGPCIGPTTFEVGPDVLEGFGLQPSPSRSEPFFESRDASPAVGANTRAASVVTRAPPRWFADLAGLARHRLRAAGVVAIHGNDGSAPWCTVTNPSRFFSFRRDRVTGRQAAAVWRRALG